MKPEHMFGWNHFGPGEEDIALWDIPESFTLESFALKAMEEMRREAHQRPDPAPYFVVVFDENNARRFHLPTAGAATLMNTDLGKTLLFGFFRNLHSIAHAFVFGSEVFRILATEEGSKHTADEYERYMDPSFEKLTEMGWLEREESLLVVAQTKTTVVQAMQAMIRKPNSGEIQVCGHPKVSTQRQDQFHGRMKMWGATDADMRLADVVNE